VEIASARIFLLSILQFSGEKQAKYRQNGKKQNRPKTVLFFI